MSLNWKEINLILQELPWEGSRIQEIRQPDFKGLVFELYHPSGAWKLYVNLSASHCRIHLLSHKPPPSPSPQRFVEILRARVRGGKILKAAQPGNNRIVRIDIQKGGVLYFLWIRVWGPSSNILLTEENHTILDALYRRPRQGEISGGTYHPPIEGTLPNETYQIRPYPSSESFNAFIETCYGELEEKEQRKRIKLELERQLSSQEVKLHAKQKGLIQRKETYQAFEAFKKQADLILANLSQIKRGDVLINVQDPITGTTLAIPLSSTLTPAENAEAYYKRYKKAKAGLQILEEELGSLQRQMQELESKRALLQQESNLSSLASHLIPSKDRKQEKKADLPPGQQYSSNGFTLLVGRTAQDNDELLRKHVRGNDLWLHTRDYPGAYVFIKTKPGKTVPLETLLDAGTLAVFFSKARQAGTADLYYTHVKHLRRAKGEKLGAVLPTQEKNLTVKIDDRRLQRILEQ